MKKIFALLLAVLMIATIFTGCSSNGSNDLGTIENGKWADFIAVEGDPLADIRAMASVKKVFKGGKLVVNKVNA